MDEREVRTCPGCGALITPQLARCRTCNTYLHGTALEGVLVESLLPPQLRASPGTGLIFLFIIFLFAFQTLVAGPQNIFGFSGYSLRLLGSIFGPSIVMGEWWRFVTSMFAHGGLIHVGFNVYALVIVGPVIEDLFDRKKMWFMTLLSGVGSMVVSYVWSVEIRELLFSQSVGASGAISGLIGAGITGGTRAGPGAAQFVSLLKRWALFMLVFGLVLSNIDNAAHIGGFIIGATLGRFVPLGLTKSVAANRALSVGMLGGLATIALCFGLMVRSILGWPGSLDADRDPVEIITHCRDELRRAPSEARRACEFAVLASPRPLTYGLLERAYEATGDTARARRVAAVLDRLGG